VEELIRELAAQGLSAVETYHSDHTPEDTERLYRAAERFHLGITGGSDFHGLNRSRAALGSLNLPDSLLSNLRSHSRQVFSSAGGTDAP
jgi:hypothetical protein